MPKDGRVMSSIEMRNLIFEALAIENPEDTPWKMTFKMYGYKGCISALRAIVEHLAIKKGLLDQVVDIPRSAWGVPGENIFYQRNTNFNDDEQNLFSEEVHLLMFQNVLSPGATGSYGDDWPYFHVTKYGLNCIDQKDILPYDPEKYLDKLKAIPSFDDWEKFYVKQSLLCYNVGAIESSIIMLGLAGEYLATKLIDSMGGFLAKNETALKLQFDTALSGKQTISTKYAEYEKVLGDVVKLKDANGNAKYAQLSSYAPLLDIPAKTVYATYLRLTRNELAHPSKVQMDRIECLTMLVSFVKYCQTQHKYLDFYTTNS